MPFLASTVALVRTAVAITIRLFTASLSILTSDMTAQNLAIALALAALVVSWSITLENDVFTGYCRMVQEWLEWVVQKVEDFSPVAEMLLGESVAALSVPS
jgi:hypothetical protein